MDGNMLSHLFLVTQLLTHDDIILVDTPLWVFQYSCHKIYQVLYDVLKNQIMLRMQEGYLDKEVPERKVLEVTESKLVGLLEVRPTQGPNQKHNQMNKIYLYVIVISKMSRRPKYIIGDVCGKFFFHFSRLVWIIVGVR